MEKKEIEKRLKELLAHAETIAATGANQRELWNSIFGIGARYSQLFPTREDRVDADQCPTMNQITNLVKQAIRPTDVPEKSGQFLVRLPKSLHQALADEAELEGVSLNQLIVAKLSVQLHRAVSR